MRHWISPVSAQRSHKHTRSLATGIAGMAEINCCTSCWDWNCWRESSALAPRFDNSISRKQSMLQSNDLYNVLLYFDRGCFSSTKDSRCFIFFLKKSFSGLGMFWHQLRRRHTAVRWRFWGQKTSHQTCQEQRRKSYFCLIEMMKKNNYS